MIECCRSSATLGEFLYKAERHRSSVYPLIFDRPRSDKSLQLRVSQVEAARLWNVDLTCKNHDRHRVKLPMNLRKISASISPRSQLGS